MPGPVRERVWPVPLQLWEDAAGPRARLGIRCILDNTTELGGCGLNTHWHRDHFLQPFTKLVIYKYFMKYDHMSRPQTSARPVRTLWSITGQDDQMLAGQPPRLSYGSRGDCGPGPVLSSTRGMGQLKEPSPCRTTDKSLVG